MRTKKNSLESLIETIKKTTESKEYDIVADLTLLKSKIFKPKELEPLLNAILEKYDNESAIVRTQLMKLVQGGNIEAIKLYNAEFNKSGGGDEVTIVDDI